MMWQNIFHLFGLNWFTLVIILEGIAMIVGGLSIGRWKDKKRGLVNYRKVDDSPDDHEYKPYQGYKPMPPMGGNHNYHTYSKASDCTPPQINNPFHFKFIIKRLKRHVNQK